MTYEKVVDTIQQNNLSWGEIDRLVLNEDTYEEMQERASFDVSDHYTTDAPAVRQTTGQEKIVYVSRSGVEMTIEL